VASYPTVAELRARFPNPLTDATKYPDATVQEAIDLAVESFEHAADVAFAPRTETLTLTSSQAGQLIIPRNKVTTVTSITGSTSGTITVDGQLIGGTVFANANGWDTTETLTVEVTHGYADTPLEVKWAVGILARKRLLRGDLDDRATQLVDNGGVVNLATPGLFGSEFGIPEVDAVLRRYQYVALI
jgi:hypothetical protein